MLGITIDNKLKFDNHVAKICRKVSQQIAVLKGMKKMLPFETRRDLYLAFILPHFNYCCETWNFCSKSAADKLERLNERARVQSVIEFPQTKLDSEINAAFLLNEPCDPHFLFYKFNENNIFNNWEKNWQNSMATFLPNEINVTDRT